MNGTVGSLFTGVRGLDLGLEQAGFRTVWACESDEACRRVIERTAPGVPVVPDVRDIDAGLERPDVLAGGFPCPDFSVAGKRLMFRGERAQLWFEFARAVRVLRPRHVVVENVPGLLAALGVVLADLAEAGYVGQWFCLRAADVGAPHRRERVFIIATATDAASADGGVGAALSATATRGRGPSATPRSGGCVATDAERDAERRPRPREVPRAAEEGEGEGSERQRVRADAWNVSTTAADADRAGRGRIAGIPQRRDAVLPDEWSDAEERSAVGGRGLVGQAEPRVPTADAAGSGRRRWPPGEGRDAEPRPTAVGPEGDAAVGNGGLVEWGAYGPAVRHWELVLGRPAPRPTDARGRLEPRFVEWMMGFPDGWTAGEKRTVRLRMLGNAVQVQVAEQVGRVLAAEAAR